MNPTHVRETFARGGWREELDVYYRQRRSVWGVVAIMIFMSAFWTNPWAYVVFFTMIGTYSALVAVRMGVLCGWSFAAWFFMVQEGWLVPGSTLNRVVGLWCLATLLLLVVWKADGVHRLRDRRLRGEPR